MSVNMLQLDNFIASICSSYSYELQHRVFMRFLCSNLGLIENFIPIALSSELAASRSYWLSDCSSSINLEQANIACWKYLEIKGRAIEILDSEDAAIRALIATLFAEPENEEFTTDSVRWFIAMLDRIGDFSTEVERNIELVTKGSG
jgi:hypothetical protein